MLRIEGIQKEDAKQSYDEISPDKDSMQRIKQLLTDNNENEIVNKLDGENWGINYSKEELIYVVEHSSASKRVRSAAYYSLLQSLDLEELKRLSVHVDFGYVDKFKNDAFRNAVAYKRVDVIQWLANEIPEYEDISPERQIEIILLAITNDSDECLDVFSKPVTDGGFGWDLNIVHPTGYTPVRMALKDNNKSLALKLVASPEEGGYGLKLKKADLRKMVNKHEYTMFSGIVPAYHRQKADRPGKPSRKTSLIQLHNAKTGIVEIYEPVSPLGMGGHGKVRLFVCTTDKTRQVAVKQCRLDNQRLLSGMGMFYEAKSVNEELEYMRMMYREQQPFLVKHFITPEGKYDFRLVMPLVEGKDMLHTLLSITHSHHVAMLFLAVASEMHRMHQLGIVHGDAKMQNILIAVTSSENESAPIFRVQLIDFGNAAKIGSIVYSYDEGREYLAPERYKESEKNIYAHPAEDVYSLAYNVEDTMKILGILRPEQKELLIKQYTSLVRFAANGRRDDPAERPSLIDFINELKAELKDYLIKDVLTKKPDMDGNVESRVSVHL